MTTELLQRASVDHSISHGAFRLLAVITLSGDGDLSPTGQQRLRNRLSACSLAEWLQQLRSCGYLPPTKNTGLHAALGKRGLSLTR